MKNKIILIRPWNEFHLANYPPLGLILLGTLLKNGGLNVKIVHCENRNRWKQRIDDALDDDVIAVGITSLTSEIIGAINIARYLKAKASVPVVWGGWHAALFPEQITASRLADYVIAGEGDLSFYKLVEELRQGKGPVNKLIRSGRVELDSLPIPLYEIDESIEHFINEKLNDKFQEYIKGICRWLPYQSSRGCPHRCSYCINVVTDNQMYKKKSAEKVVYEMGAIKDRFDLTHIKLIDDNFFSDINRTRKIALGMIKNGIGVTWDAECRVDYFKERFIDRDTLKLFKESGLVQMTFGVESGSEYSLARMKKDIEPDQSLAAVALCDSLHITTRCSFVLDIPGDSKKDIYESAKLIKKLRRFKRCVCGVHTYRPYPKSELCQKLINDKVLYQPNCLEEWEDKRYVAQFTSTDVVRKWQANYKLSSRLSFYQSLESGMWLKPHQIRHKYVKILNSIFVLLARWRNSIYFYYLDFDRPLYIFFKNWYNKKHSISGKEEIDDAENHRRNNCKDAVAEITGKSA